MTEHRPVLVCGSANPDKVAEISALLEGVVDLLPRPADLADVVEDADTLLGNARLKAVAVCAAASLPAMSDDTGLFVDALDGAPGVFAARFAGENASYADNRAKLLEALVGSTRRGAEFRTVVVVAYPDGSELVVDGVCRGEIATAERGQRGFGYDSVFLPFDGGGRTFAQMTDAEKNAISHRGKALAALRTALATSTR